MPSSSAKNSTTVRSQTAVRVARAALHTAYALSEDLGTSFAERLFTSPRRFPRPERERVVLATGRRFTLPVVLRSPRSNGHRIELVGWRWGVGPTVLLVHGWEGRGSQLGALVEPLVTAGLSVVAFDAPAHGDSPGARLYLPDFADAIADVAEAVGPLHAIVGHSFGAAGVLLAHSRAGLDVPRNVMIAPNVVIEDAFRSFARAVGLDDADRTLLEHTIMTRTGLTFEALQVERLAACRDAGLLVVHDRDDREIPLTQAERLAASWPNARLIATEGLGHRRILRDPAVIEEIVGTVREGVAEPASDLVREIDRLVGGLASFGWDAGSERH